LDQQIETIKSAAVFVGKGGNYLLALLDGLDDARQSCSRTV
jgi:hypothetical protein